MTSAPPPFPKTNSFRQSCGIGVVRFDAMSRLLSFQGPSTPSRDHATPPEKSPSRGGNTPNKSNRSARPKKSAGRGRDPIGSTNAPLGATGSSPKEEEASFVETEIHKTLRKTLLGIRKASREWDETVRGGFQAAKDMVDARTTIQYAILATARYTDFSDLSSYIETP